MNSLADQRALVVGLGGLGCPASLVLAEAGIGQLTLADPDAVEASNLPRQPWHRPGDVGAPKVESASRGLRRAFPGVDVEALRAPVDEDNVERLFDGADLVIDGTDQIATKLLLSDWAVRTGTPLVHAGVLGMQGQVLLIAPQGPCLRCLFEEAPKDAPRCTQAGVLGTVAGVVGTFQGWIGAQVLQGHSRPGVLWRFDGVRMRQRAVSLSRSPDCPECQRAPPAPRAQGPWAGANPR